MLLSLGILIFLLIGYYTGARRGLALQLVHVLGYLITYILAANLFQPFARFLEMYVPYPNILPDSTIHIYDTALHLKLDRIFYNGVAFVGIMLLGWLITRLLARMVQFWQATLHDRDPAHLPAQCEEPGERERRHSHLNG